MAKSLSLNRMSELIDKVKSRPESVKQRIALVAALVLTCIIVTVWLAIIKPKDSGVAVNGSESVADDLKPLFMIFNKAKDGVKEVKDNAKTLKAETGASSAQE